MEGREGGSSTEVRGKLRAGAAATKASANTVGSPEAGVDLQSRIEWW